MTWEFFTDDLRDYVADEDAAWRNIWSGDFDMP